MSFNSPFWDQAQTIAWVNLRDPTIVQEIGDYRGYRGSKDTGDVWLSAVMSRRELELGQEPLFPTHKDAEDALREALAAGRIIAEGLENDEGDPRPVPASHWPHLRFYWKPDIAGPDDPFRRGATRWHALRFAREAVVREYPQRTTPATESSALNEPSEKPGKPDPFAAHLKRADLELERIVEAAAHHGDLAPDDFPTRNAAFRALKSAVDRQLLNAARLTAQRQANSMTLVTLRDLRAFAQRQDGEPSLIWLPALCRRWAEARGEGLTASNSSTIANETQCQAWLAGLMRQGDPTQAKSAYWSEAGTRWPRLSKRGFVRAWANAVNESGNAKWKAPGAKSKRRIESANQS